MKSLRIRIFAFIAGIILLFGALLMILNQTCLTAFYYNHGEKLLKNALMQVRRELPQELTYHTDAFSAVEDANGVEIILYRNNGDVVYATPLRDFDPYADNPGLVRARLQQIMEADITVRRVDSASSRFELQREKGSSRTFLAYRAAVDENGSLWAVARVSADILENSAGVANSFMSLTVAAVLLVALVGSYFIAAHLSAPIREMNRTTRAMSRFDFSHKVAVKGKDEIAQLGESINILSDNTSSLLAELQEKNARLEKEVEREHALVEMREEFVSNVSHELKTPIAIIQGYAEGLRLNVADDPERMQMYCETIESESLKMDRLVKQLLELSRLESGQSPLEEAPFPLTELLTETVDRISSITDDVTVRAVFDKRERVAYGDEMRLGEVLQNYLANAISHAKGENRVEVSVSETKTGYRVSVFNTGDPIPEEMQEKLWVSFFRADKSRSRENGNAGLGLSIAGTIMKQHGQGYGTYNVDTPVSGVVFWFDVKRCDE